MEWIIYLFVLCLMGFWCYKIAEKNGRTKWFAFIMGVLFAIWAVLVYYAIGKSPALRDKEMEDRLHARMGK